MMMPKIELIQGDCLEKMKDIPDKSIDMILCDLPYGTTACKWDTIIPFEPLWEQYKRIIKDNGAIVLTASQPFTSALVMSNIKMFKYEWIWEKTIGTNFALVKKQPSKKHENILVFYKKQPKYNPIMTTGKPYIDVRKKVRKSVGVWGGGTMDRTPINNTGTRYPSTIQVFSNGNNKSLHPTQKPVALFEYLIKTYTNEGDLVLDNCMGSFTTAIACLNTKRSFIGIEKDEHYFQVGKDRLEKHLLTLDFTPEITYNQV
jgi:site-specific DNA-methyltransferase (adenine-specific)